MADTKLAERLATILGILSAGRNIKVECLAEQFNTSNRTIQRDLSERLAFLNLEKTESGWRLDRKSINPITSSQLKDFAKKSGIKKFYPILNTRLIQFVIQEESINPYDVKAESYQHISKNLYCTHFLKLEIAIANSNLLDFYYDGKSYKNVEPYKISSFKGCWYLLAIDARKIKSFLITKMQLINSKGIVFHRRENVLEKIEKENSIWISEEKFEAKLRIDKEVSERFLRREVFPKQNVERQENGDLIIKTFIASENQIFSQIKYWLPHIKVISPNSMREKLRKELQDYIASC